MLGQSIVFLTHDRLCLFCKEMLSLSVDGGFPHIIIIILMLP